VVVEAQLSGTPIVATALGGALDLIKDNQDGVLVPADNPTAMTTAWERAFNDEVGRSRWIRNGLDGFQTFSPEAHCDQVEALYAGLMNRDGDRELAGTISAPWAAHHADEAHHEVHLVVMLPKA
jgi:glycosyltransferase involved in cell wall biosynthesis